MSDQALMLIDYGRRTVVPTDAVQRLIDEALAVGALIGRVTNSDENTQAVAAMAAIKRILSDIEKARKACKEPVIDLGTKIDTLARYLRTDPEQEINRIARLVGDFQQLELAKARAAEAARLKELAEIEQRKQEELAKAKSHEEMDQIHARANQEAVMTKPPPTPVRAAGQRVEEDWEFTVTNPDALYREYPHCVKLEPIRSEIRALLKNGITLPGVTAEKVVKAKVRLKPERQAIEA